MVSIPAILLSIIVSGIVAVLSVLPPPATVFFTAIFSYVIAPILFLIFIIGSLIASSVKAVRKDKPKAPTKQINWDKTLLIMICIIATPVLLINISKHFTRRETDSGTQHSLEQVYKELGYTGTIRDVSTRTVYTGSEYEVVDYTYVEKVDGEEITFKQVAEIEKSGELGVFGSAQLYLYAEDEAFQIDHVIKHEAMFKQPQVKNYFSTLSEQIKQETLIKNMTFQSVTGSVIWNNKTGIHYILSQFEENKKQGKPLNGYYNIDVKELVNKNYVKIEVDYSVNDKERDTSKYFTEFLAYVKQKDFSQYWDGTYQFSFDYRHDGGRSGSVSDIVIVTVKDGKAIRFTTHDDKPL